MPITIATSIASIGWRAGVPIETHIGTEPYFAREVPLATSPAVSVIILRSRDEAFGSYDRVKTAALVALLVVVGFKHALDGMKVFIDDYVHEPGTNFAIKTLLLFLAVGAAAIALYALAALSFGGSR